MCTQRCIAPPVGPGGGDGYGLWVIDKPCATDGCCVKITEYYLKDGEIIAHTHTETLSECTDFHPVDCTPFIPFGGCRVGQCN